MCVVNVLVNTFNLNACQPGCPCYPVFVSGILEALLRKKKKGGKEEIYISVTQSMDIEELEKCLTEHNQIKLLETDYEKRRVKVALKEL